MVLDQNAQRQYDQAKGDRDRNRMILFDLGDAINQLDQKINDDSAMVVQLIRSYASLSLAGSIAGPKQKALRFLETRLEIQRNKNSDPSLVNEMERNLKIMKEKLKAVEEAEKRAEI